MFCVKMQERVCWSNNLMLEKYHISVCCIIYALILNHLIPYYSINHDFFISGRFLKAIPVLHVNNYRCYYEPTTWQEVHQNFFKTNHSERLSINKINVLNISPVLALISTAGIHHEGWSEKREKIYITKDALDQLAGFSRTKGRNVFWGLLFKELNRKSDKIVIKAVHFLPMNTTNPNDYTFILKENDLAVLKSVSEVFQLQLIGWFLFHKSQEKRKQRIKEISEFIPLSAKEFIVSIFINDLLRKINNRINDVKKGKLRDSREYQNIYHIVGEFNTDNKKNQINMEIEAYKLRLCDLTQVNDNYSLCIERNPNRHVSYINLLYPHPPAELITVEMKHALSKVNEFIRFNDKYKNNQELEKLYVNLLYGISYIKHSDPGNYTRSNSLIFLHFVDQLPVVDFSRSMGKSESLQNFIHPSEFDPSNPYHLDQLNKRINSGIESLRDFNLLVCLSYYFINREVDLPILSTMLRTKRLTDEAEKLIRMLTLHLKRPS